MRGDGSPECSDLTPDRTAGAVEPPELHAFQAVLEDRLGGLSAGLIVAGENHVAVVHEPAHDRRARGVRRIGGGYDRGPSRSSTALQAESIARI